MEKLVLIDGNSLLNRAFYAMPILSTKEGVYTNAVFGFTNMLVKIATDVKPEYLAVAFDLKAPTFRHKMYADYKGTRKPMPDELREQVPLIKEVLSLMNIAICEKEGVEADDVIGTISKHAGVKTFIITGDKDSFQLVDENVSVLFTKRGITELDELNAENFTQKTELVPSQIIELKSLMGDASDNIPGVKGVGEKTAKTLLLKYGTLDGVYAHLDEITGKLKEKLTEDKENAYLSHTLATINTDCGIDFALSDMRFITPFPYAVRKKFISLEFKALSSKLSLFESPAGPTSGGSSAGGSTATEGGSSAEANGFGGQNGKINTNFTNTFPENATEKNLSINPAWLNAAANETPKRERSNEAKTTAEPAPELITINDLAEVAALDFSGDAVFTLSSRRADLYIPAARKEYVFGIKELLMDDGFNLAEILRALAPLFSASLNDGKEKSGSPRLIVYDKKELMHRLKEVDLSLSARTDDVSIMKYLADFSGKVETLAEVLEEYGETDELPAYSLYKIFRLLSEKLDEENMRKLYSDLELPLCEVLFDMETAGFKVDYDALSESGRNFKARLDGLESKIREYAGDEELNVNSPVQLGEVLFGKMKLGKAKKTKRGYSTSAETLESVEDAHPIVPLILEYRRIQKLFSTYVEGLKPLIDRKTGLVFTSFNQTVTTTGRLSSKEPNLQNIPVREEEGRELRKFFVPRDSEHILIGADYSQIELRLLAAFSGCKGLINAFLGGHDVHAETASKVFGVKLSEVTPEMRRAAKAVNFGIIYGISEYGLAKSLKVSPAAAKEYIAGYFREYPEVKKYMDDNVAFAKKSGYAITMLGRRRYIREINASNFNLRSFGERAAMNMPLQGSSADIIKLAMLGVHGRLKKEGLASRLILQVHDELIIDALRSEAEEVKKILVEEMEGAVKLCVPLTVELGSGETWYDAK